MPPVSCKLQVGRLQVSQPQPATCNLPTCNIEYAEWAAGAWSAPAMGSRADAAAGHAAVSRCVSRWWVASGAALTPPTAVGTPRPMLGEGKEWLGHAFGSGVVVRDAAHRTGFVAGSRAQFGPFVTTVPAGRAPAEWFDAPSASSTRRLRASPGATSSKIVPVISRTDRLPALGEV